VTPPAAVTISGGELTLTTDHTHLIIDTEGGAGTDNLDTINMSGVQGGHRLLCRCANDARAPIFTQSGNIDLIFGTTATGLGDTSEWLALVYNSTTSKWEQVYHTSNRS